MMTKEEVLTQLGKTGIVAVVRAETAERSVAVSEALIEGGVKAIELTFTVPNADEAISTLVKKYADRNDVLIGAGTVLTDFEAHQAIKAGAKFIVAPSFSTKVASVCNAAGVNYVPGCFTPTEVYTAKETGVALTKIFPAGLVGPSVIRELHGPFPGVRIMPSGGVNLDNLTDWLDAGAYVVGVGGSLVGNADTDLTEITENAKKFSSKFAEWQANH